jgi:hypothetical protein
MKRLSVALAASLILVVPAGCGESSESGPEATTLTGIGVTGESSETEPDEPTLTGIGATKDDFAKGKEPNTIQNEGCCFGPTQEDGSDRYYAVEYDEEDRVTTYSMSFAPTITFAEAQNVILGELPSDAKLVATINHPLCRSMHYSSALLRQVTGGTGAPLNIDVAFYSNHGDTPYSDSRISDIIVGFATPGAVVDC